MTRSSGSNSTLCAVICTRNRPVDLRRSLLSLSWQTTPCTRVVIVDDSDRETRAEIRRIVDESGLPASVLVKDTPGLTASRNLAIESVTDDLILFLDDDVVLHPMYVARMVAAFTADPGLVGAGGSIDDDHDYELPWIRALLMVPGRKTGRVYRSGWSSQTPRGRSLPVEHLIGCNMAYRTSVVADRRFADGFRGYALGEDLEFSFRLHRDGHRLAVVGDARLWHLTADPRHDEAWGYREMIIRPMVAGERFHRLAFLVAATVFVVTNARRNRDRARGNLLGMADVLRGRPPRDLQTRRKVSR